MHFLRTLTALSALKATVVHAGPLQAISLTDGPESAVALRKADKVEHGSLLTKRSGCSPGQILVYEFPNSSGSYATLCTSVWAFGACTILVTAYGIQSMIDTITDWINLGQSDASAAGPQIKRDEHAITWNDLLKYTTSHPSSTISNTSVAAGASSARVASTSVTNLAFHEDGFSASFNLTRLKAEVAPQTSPLSTRQFAFCDEQIHIHYWANGPNHNTLLDSNDIYLLAHTAINDSLDENYRFACYEMRNSGQWDGWLRICYNPNQSQVGCGYCGGHNN